MTTSKVDRLTVEELRYRLKAAQVVVAAQESDAEYDALMAEMIDAERRAAAVPAIRKAREELGTQDIAFKVVETARGIVSVKRANPLLYRHFVYAGKFTTNAFEKLVTPTIFYPSKEAAAEIFEDVPHALVQCADAVAELAGVRAKQIAPKS